MVTKISPIQMHVDAFRVKVEQDYAYNLNVDNIAHELEKIEEDIEDIIDSKLKFDKHINQKINKANSIMAVIRRSFTTLNQHNFVPLYKALVRSHLDCNIYMVPF